MVTKCGGKIEEEVIMEAPGGTMSGDFIRPQTSLEGILALCVAGVKRGDRGPVAGTMMENRDGPRQK